MLVSIHKYGSYEGLGGGFNGCAQKAAVVLENGSFGFQQVWRSRFCIFCIFFEKNERCCSLLIRYPLLMEIDGILTEYERNMNGI